jgi:hypothetical protein
MKKIARILGTTAAVLVPVLALAAAPPTPAVRRACSPDARRLCASVLAQADRRRHCMRMHHAQLSLRCKAAIADQMMERAAH